VFCRFYNELSWLVNRRLQKPIDARDRDLELLLMIGLFQLLHTRIPDHAAIGETVDAVRKLNKDWASGLINAVLRRLQRERDGLAAEIASASDAVRYSHPQWLVEMISADWPEQRERIFTANNGRPPFCLRVNTQRGSRDDYLRLLNDDDKPAEPTLLSADGVRLAQACDVYALPGFTAGLVSVQDEAAQLCASLFDGLPADARILDACAAPGGKTAHLAERFHGARITALDIDERRTRRITDNLERLGLSATVKVADAAQDSWWDGECFDAILLDAPCSATGVLRRHPDGKWLRKKSDIAKLARQQRTLLDALWPKLRPGGCAGLRHLFGAARRKTATWWRPSRRSMTMQAKKRCRKTGALPVTKGGNCCRRSRALTASTSAVCAAAADAQSNRYAGGN
jgi:16S rRNA (cytosine967-C5)-methyltransferase